MSFGYSGYLLAESQWLLQIARVAGVYSLSFVFAILSLGVLQFAKQTTRRYQMMFLVTMVFLIGITVTPRWMMSETASENSEREYSVITIDTMFPASLLRSEEGVRRISEELEEAIASALQEYPDYIILPEGANYFNQESPLSTVKSWFQFKYGRPGATIIDSGRVDQGESAILQTFIYNGPDNPVEQVQKRYLVPQGEFISSLYRGLFWMFGLNEATDQAAKYVTYVPGPLSDQSGMDEKVPGILFCFESVNPRGVRTLLKERPGVPFVAHPVSHAWFYEPHSLWHQLDTMLKVQAVWNQVHIISAGNLTEGRVVSPAGEVIIPEVVAEGDMWKVKRITLRLAEV